MLVPPLALRIGQGRFDLRIREIRLQGRVLQQTQEMLCVLIEILGRNGVASGSGFTRKRQVAVVALLRVGGSVVVAMAPARSRIVSVVRR
jgi:hypothetical protein